MRLETDSALTLAVPASQVVFLFQTANTLKPKSLTYEHLTSLKHLAGCQPKNDSGPIRQLAPCLLGMSQL